MPVRPWRAAVRSPSSATSTTDPLATATCRNDVGRGRRRLFARQRSSSIAPQHAPHRRGTARRLPAASGRVGQPAQQRTRAPRPPSHESRTRITTPTQTAKRPPVARGQHERGDHCLVGQFGQEHGRRTRRRTPRDIDQSSRAAGSVPRSGDGRRSALVDIGVHELRRHAPRARPATMVCRAATGPQRSHASTGSAMAPANAGRSSDHTATSPTAPDGERRRARRRARGSRPRRASPSPAPSGRRPRRAVAQLGEQHRLAGLQPQRRRVGRRRPVDAEPDVHAGGPQVDDRGDARRQDQVARRAVRHTDAAPRRDGAPRRRSGITQWATHVRSVHQPVRSRYSIGRQPNVASENSSSSAFSAKWVCRRTSSRSASSAERTISGSVTLNGEHGASAIRTIAPWRRSWWRRTARSLAARIVVVVLHHVVGRQTRRPSPTATSSRVSGGSACRVARGVDLGRQQVAGAARVQVEVIGRGGAPARAPARPDRPTPTRRRPPRRAPPTAGRASAASRTAACRSSAGRRG